VAVCGSGTSFWPVPPQSFPGCQGNASKPLFCRSRPSTWLRAVTGARFLPIQKHFVVTVKQESALLRSLFFSSDNAPSCDFPPVMTGLTHLDGCPCWAGAPLLCSLKATQQCVQATASRPRCFCQAGAQSTASVPHTCAL
jgi:hypothetical protein